MIGIRENKITRVPLVEAVEMVHFCAQFGACVLIVCANVDQGGRRCDCSQGFHQSNVFARTRILAELGELYDHIDIVHRETVAGRAG